MVRERADIEADPAGTFMQAKGSSLVPSLSRHNKEAARRYTLFIFCVSTALLFADQNLLAPNLTDAARDLGLNDRERDEYLGGWTNALFFIVGAPASILVGYLMDRHDRPTLLWACVVIGELPCIATVFVTKFWQLLLTRAVTGIAIGGASPLTYGLLADMYPPGSRLLVSTLVGSCIGAGGFIGQATAGVSGLSWRLPFVLIAVPSILVATLMLFTTKDPKRGGAEQALQGAFQDESFEYTETLTWRKFINLCRIPTNVLMIIQGLPGCLPWGMAIAYLNDYLEQQGGLSKRAATSILLVFGVGNTIGGLTGGLLGQMLWNWKPAATPVFAGLTVLAGIPPLIWLLDAGVAKLAITTLCAVSLYAGIVAAMGGVNVRPVLMNVNEPESRGLVLALQATLDDLGKGLGPAIVAVLIASIGRKAAFIVATCGWIPCGLMMIVTGLFVQKDEQSMQQRLANTIHEARQEMAVVGDGETVPLTADIEESLSEQ